MVWAAGTLQKRFTGIVAEKLWLGIWEILGMGTIPGRKAAPSVARAIVD
jgi:hypothetical protein